MAHPVSLVEDDRYLVLTLTREAFLDVRAAIPLRVQGATLAFLNSRECLAFYQKPRRAEASPG